MCMHSEQPFCHSLTMDGMDMRCMHGEYQLAITVNV